MKNSRSDLMVYVRKGERVSPLQRLPVDGKLVHIRFITDVAGVGFDKGYRSNGRSICNELKHGNGKSNLQN